MGDDAQPQTPILERIGRITVAIWEQALAMLSFVGESSIALGGWIAHPRRVRWRPVLFNLRRAGFDALPIVGLLSFLLGIVVLVIASLCMLTSRIGVYRILNSQH